MRLVELEILWYFCFVFFLKVLCVYIFKLKKGMFIKNVNNISEYRFD